MSAAFLLLALAPLAHLPEAKSLTPYRETLTSIQAAADASPSPNAPTVKAWVASQSARLDAEDAFRANTALPLCQAHWGLDAAREAIKREKSNPAGVWDLVALHTAGQSVQYYTGVIKALNPAYTAFRKHPYVKWQDEGVCVASTENQ